MTHDTEMTIEYAAFRLKNGVTTEALMAASAAIQTQFLAATDGFVRRDLVATGDDGYADIVLWESHAKAVAAMEGAMQSPACASYFSLMEFDVPEGESPVLHWRRLAGYQA